MRPLAGAISTRVMGFQEARRLHLALDTRNDRSIADQPSFQKHWYQSPPVQVPDLSAHSEQAAPSATANAEGRKQRTQELHAVLQIGHAPRRLVVRSCCRQCEDRTQPSTGTWC